MSFKCQNEASQIVFNSRAFSFGFGVFSSFFGGGGLLVFFFCFWFLGVLFGYVLLLVVVFFLSDTCIHNSIQS